VPGLREIKIPIITTCLFPPGLNSQFAYIRWIKTISMKIWFLLIVLIGWTILLPAQKRTLRPDDVYRLKTTTQASVSPDGEWILYTLTSVDSAKNKRNADVWMTKWDGSASVQLTNSPDGESDPKWSPDGKYISFVSPRIGGRSQLFLLNRMGGEAVKLTDLKGELDDYEWSPDGKKIAFLQKDPLDTSDKKKNEPWVIGRYHFKHDGDGYLYDQRKTHLYVYDIREKILDTLTHGRYEEVALQWSPDGQRIAFVSNRTEDPDRNANADIFIIEAKAGAEPRQLTTWKGSDHSPQWSPDGKTIAYLRSTGDGNFIMYDQPILCTIAADGGEPVLISKELDRPVTNPRWNKEGTAIAALIKDDCRQYIGSFDLASRKFSKVIEGDRVFTTLALHPNGSWMATMSDPANPPELYAIENINLRKLTNVQEEFISNLELASVQKISSISKDGTKVSSLLYTPAGSDGRNMPAVFFLHGGPVSQDDFGFDFTRQMLAANGYAVVAVNYRGSNGRGLAHTRAIMGDWGNKEVVDVIGVADHLAKTGVIDGSNLGIGGWSYGGILTNYTIASDTRFKAACSGAGSSLQLSLVGVDQYITQFENEIGFPWEGKNLQKYLKISYPYFKAGKIKTPTLFLTGEKDFNVPAIGSEQMYQALRSLNVPTELIVYPGQFHGITNPAYQKDRFERYIAWFDRYLKRKSF
jgi:dipeptidyl aminopeptidase/acylaminoacyl peptidase